jgi:hypothetical protein
LKFANIALFVAIFDKLAHLLKIASNLQKLVFIKLLIELFQKWNIALKVAIKVSNIDKGSKNLGWKYKFECFPILLNTEKKAEGSQAV